jgi:hypothetical protein
VSRALAHAFSAAVALPLLAASFAACSVGAGNGFVNGDLNVKDCWAGRFDLQPNFFAAVPYQSSQEIRIQNGGDYETFSDGVEILIEDVFAIRPGTGPDAGGEMGVPLRVSLPPSVTAPGVPVVATSDPARIHLALYLQRTCRTQDVALYALDAVTLNANGDCNPLHEDGGEPVVTCPSSSNGIAPSGNAIDGGTQDAGARDGSATDAATPVSAGDAAGTASGPIGHSTITFQSLFDNDESEPRADNRLNQGTFDVYLADPREACAGGIGPPPPCRGHLTGAFKFYFERGRPAQPFP